MDRCLLDTSTISEIIRPTAKRLPPVASHVRGYLRSFGRFTFSEITCYEILRGFRKKRAVAQVEQFRQFCQHSDLLPVTYEVLDRAAELWAEGQLRGTTIEDIDLVIAATALVASLPLVTANPKHFLWIVGLSVSNWRND